MRINETPVRTAKNFNINNIEIEDSILEDMKQISLAQTNFKDFEKNASKTPIGIYQIQTDKLDITDNISMTYDIDKYLGENVNVVVKDKEIRVRIVYYSENMERNYHNGNIYIEVCENSKLVLDVINFTNSETYNFLSIIPTLQKNAIAEINIVELGGKTTVSKIQAKQEESSNLNINTIYFQTDEQTLDMNYTSNLNGENSSVNIDVQGALDKKATKHFKGTINFVKGAKNSKGFENEACYILSEQAKAVSLPMLLCSEEDVEGNHSSSCGDINKELLFYLMTRGFSKTEAQKLLVKAKFHNVLDRLNGIVREKVEEQLDNKLN